MSIQTPFEAHVESIPHAEFKGQGQILIKVTEVKVTQQRTMVKVTAEVNECKLGNRDIYILIKSHIYIRSRSKS